NMIGSSLPESLDAVIWGLVAGVIAAAAVVLEFRTNYLEQAIGRYLSWHNETRRESGQIWETVEVSEDVQDRLDDLVSTRRQERVVEDEIETLDQLVELVYERGKKVMTRDRFLEMYTDELPLYQSSLILGPVEMVELIGRLPAWQRTLIVMEEGDLKFYLIDGLNGMLDEISLSREYVTFFLSEKGTRSQGLDAFARLRENIYPADIFYDAWALLTPQERAGIPLSSMDLISWRYRLQRCAASHSHLIGGRMEMGFELSTDEGLVTVRILGRSLSVVSLLDRMESIAAVGRGAGRASPVFAP
ncbi:MAG: hypothetical protein U9N45_04365, partial [Gemmatimonadota bacterium]|nr:hypothetical protein [Gemmatimonadota bacterium]